MVVQYEIVLPQYRKGLHLITSTIHKKLGRLPKTGILNLFIQHTSAGLTLNENADPSARADLQQFINRIAPENEAYFTHTLEGDDDMPAHIKSSLIGASVSIPITNHKMNLGTWQGIYLCEFRNHGGQRRIIATAIGE